VLELLTTFAKRFSSALTPTLSRQRERGFSYASGREREAAAEVRESVVN
jgi:hypothetical protein